MASKPGNYLLITGATGFLGKVVLEEIVRQECGQVFVLIRPREGRDAIRRFHDEIASSPCLALVRQGWEGSVEVVAGDLTLPDLGIGSRSVRRLSSLVTHIINCASVKASDSVSLSNIGTQDITNTLNLLELAKKCSLLRRFVHTSTAYVASLSPGPLFEILQPQSKPASTLYNELLVSDGNILAGSGYHNILTLSKALTENLLLERHGSVPLTIVRPSFMSASWQHPFPGWVEEESAFAGFMIACALGLIQTTDKDPQAIVDIIPVDEVAKRLIAEALDTYRPWVPYKIVYAVASLCKGVRLGRAISLITTHFQASGGGLICPLTIRSPKTGLSTMGETMDEKIKDCHWTKERISRILSRLGDVSDYLGFSYDFRPSVPLTGSFSIEDHMLTSCDWSRKYLVCDLTQECVRGQPNTKSLNTVTRQPSLGKDRSFAFRTASLLFDKVLRKMYHEVTFDLSSFQSALAKVPQGTHLVIVPTHRSYVDFLILPYIFLTRTDVGIKPPRIAAAAEFSKIPGLGRLLPRLGAFYLKRGQGKADPQLSEQITSLLDDQEGLMFFIEGKRSRSRQFLPPRRGMLRCLQATGGNFTVLPVAISYDRVPEEASMVKELNDGITTVMKLRKLALWLMKLFRQEPQLGRLHVSCGEPLSLCEGTDVFFLSKNIMRELQKNTTTSSFHLQCFIDLSPTPGVDYPWLREAIVARGGIVLDSPLTLRDVTRIQPLVQKTFQYHWIHLFFNDYRRLLSQNEAMSHFMEENDHIRAKFDMTLPEDDKIRNFLATLFRPICIEYVRTAESLRKLRLFHKTSVSAGLIYSSQDSVIARSAMRCLEARGLITEAATDKSVYHISSSLSELDLFIQACNFG